MKKFLDESFILETPTAEKLFHGHAKEMPIIDYHCHLPPEDIASDRQFANLTEIWLEGDHYKWRAMRTNGVDERYCTGDATPFEKFEKWAETVPYTMRNPLYHWTHMELKRYFGIDKILNKETAKEIYDECTAKLQTPEYSVRNLLRKMKVEVVCTTDDPADSLEFHQKIKEEGIDIKVLPTFRPDKSLAVEDTSTYNAYIDSLATTAKINITNLDELKEALTSRAEFFNEMGGRLSDHGLETIYNENISAGEAKVLFAKIRSGIELTTDEIAMFKSHMLVFLGELYHTLGWTQQFHLGALRNNSSRMVKLLGPDTGFDSIGDFEIGRPLSGYLNKLDTNDKLTKTILYNLNPRDNELMATMIGNFNDGSVAGKMQFGSGWWFLDQKDGMQKQMEALSNMGLLSRFVGMLTDSRSFLSFPRHEYFRRILCNMLGNDVENGLLPNEEKWLGEMVENICYNNANNFFGF
ncbi:glucuronate isomerase [Flammeovirgaceae bacterium SG7u.111]|nr:glucuronate isomerase [Flammeovirgaceae bacterium SG7u.132]WPO36623.1 glucuronate isomerase [Flammeovirgaceae bacterium SG7u.111]